jgi:tetratricopeptide (TPR) repeat protein
LDEIIDAVSAALEKQPGDHELWLRRADLRRLQGEWEAAAEDIAAARGAGALPGTLALARAQLAVSRADWETAARELPVLARELPENAEGWRLAANVETARGRHTAAAAAWSAVVAKAETPWPDDFISLARERRAFGADDEAIGALDAGLHQLGEASALLEEAVEIEAALHRWDAALARIGRLVAGAGNPARWLARRGDLEEQASRPAQARASRREALAAIESLPPARRNTPVMSALAEKLHAQLGLAPP